MSAGRMFYFLLAALITGIALGSFVDHVIAWIGVTVVSGVIFAFTTRSLAISLLVTAVFGVGVCITQHRVHSVIQTHQALTAALPFEISGHVEDVRTSSSYTTFVIASERMRLRVQTYQKAVYEGTTVQVTCTALDEEIYLPMYVASGIDAVCREADISLNSVPADPNSINRLRSVLLSAIHRAIPSPESELLQGLLLGKQASLPPQLQDALQKTGTTHIVVLSGFNITVIAFVIHGFFRRFRIPLWHITFWSIVAIWMFVLLAGFSPPTVRAALMVSCVLIAQGRGRGYGGAYALLLSGAVMLLHNPLLLRYGLSFQLSFLATTAVLCKDYFVPQWRQIPDFFSIRDNIRTTVAATLATLPLQVLTFGTASSIGVLSNALILPLVPPAMAFGVVLLLSSLLSSSIAVFAGLPAFVLLRCMTGIIESGARLPFAFVTLPSVASLAGIALIGGLILWNRKRKDKTTQRSMRTPSKISMILMSLCGLACCVGIFLYLQPRHTSVFFFDVGQGDAALIRQPDGFDIVIDSGPDESIVSHVSRTRAYHDRTIELFILTHPHTDHVQGFFSLAEKFDIEEVWFTGAVYESAVYDRFMRVIEDKQITTKRIASGKQQAGGITFSVLWPEEQYTDDNINNTSLVLHANVQGTEFLFMGDAEIPVEEQLLTHASDPLDADVLKIGHQGSHDASSQAFLEAVSPWAAIISVGAGNSFGHPHQDTLDRIGKHAEQIIRTDVCGTVEVVLADNAFLRSRCHP